jgi:hypothetical protein
LADFLLALPCASAGVTDVFLPAPAASRRPSLRRPQKTGVSREQKQFFITIQLKKSHEYKSFSSAIPDFFLLRNCRRSSVTANFFSETVGNPALRQISSPKLSAIQRYGEFLLRNCRRSIRQPKVWLVDKILRVRERRILRYVRGMRRLAGDPVNRHARAQKKRPPF